MKTAFHEQLGFAAAHDINGLCGGGVAVRHVDDLETIEIETNCSRNIDDLCFWSHEYRGYQSRIPRFDGATK